ncbi:putative phospholipase carboxylesterase protein [Daldinia childiae]|uniref:putative phospholipase carboxylesterase protein n=1 Tax=Daldinia childiae TaxID=326645 RepID=UPI0014468C05|nr:putative phospholipase carboxylesterase protein [Daldinia childiae]KAF3057292.1 putative phospholipase carboxylesterase protein [Daldinia childiae]
MSLLQQKYAALINPDVLRAHQKPILLATGITAAVTPLLAYAWSCYREWLTLGPGGIPYHFFGWLLQTSLHLIARSDTREPLPGPYKRLEDVAAMYGAAATKSYFGNGQSQIPKRKGGRPTIPTFVAPQRQTSDIAPAAVVAAEKAFLDALAAANTSLFEARNSKLEGPLHQALWLRLPSASTADDAEKQKTLQELRTRVGRGSDGEFAHVHGEGSVHVTLSPADAKAAIEAEWAERHPIAGVWGSRAMVPWGFVLVYAPRDEAEFAVFRELMLAGARYVTEGAGVEVVAPE